MFLESKLLGGKEVREPFTIPSGIVTTAPSVIKLLAEYIPELGIITTKSIGPKPRSGNREPILAEKCAGTFSNAVGLANPGADAFAEELKEIYPLPDNKFLLSSIFGGNADEFVYVAKKLAPYVDGFELNFSCPHAEGHGLSIGSDRGLVSEIIKAIKELDVVKQRNIPVLAKLSPIDEDIGRLAKVCVDSGADGIVAINTNKPETLEFNGSPILTNKFGGMSGQQVTERGVECIKQIREAIGEGYPIIGMGGIASAKDVRAYEDAGATFFGIGSALAGMTTPRLKEYFEMLGIDMKYETNMAVDLTFIGNKLMEYHDMPVRGVQRFNANTGLIELGGQLPSLPGQFVMLAIPGKGEKPFSVMSDNPLQILYRIVGPHTKDMASLRVGNHVNVRGPYGNCFPSPKEYDEVMLAGGGCGVAPLHFYHKMYPGRRRMFVGISSRDDYDFISEIHDGLEDSGAVVEIVGDTNRSGEVVNFMETVLGKNNLGETAILNCGPEKLMAAMMNMQSKYVASKDIWLSVENYMKCGVGICGSCATDDGYRSCVDGPVFSAGQVLGWPNFGLRYRGADGGWIKR